MPSIFRRKKIKDYQIYPDEILLDSENIPKFDTQQFEGRLERPISKRAFFALSIILVIIAAIYLGQIAKLQIINGRVFAERSQKNTLKRELFSPLRAVIVDRNGNRIAWNDENGKREYTDKPGFAHLLGHIGLPSQEDLSANPNILRNIFVGKDGVEKAYEDVIRGNYGIKLIEVDSQNNIVSESVQLPPQKNDDFKLTIDADLQTEIFKALELAAKNLGYQGGAGVIMDVNNGDLLALTSYPEYDLNSIENSLKNQKNNPFLNRAISGLYIPGSIVKPFIALAALKEGIISPQKQIYSSGSISLPNPYNPELKNVFKDWKAHGWVDMKRAIAVSSDVYFYTIGGGYEDQRGLGIEKIESYAKIFGMNSKTGVDLPGEISGIIPNQSLKAKINPKDPTWRIGDTYNASIGQGYFQVTPIEMVVYAAALANNGKLIEPHIAMDFKKQKEIQTIDIAKENFDIVKEAMLMAVKEGTATSLNIYGVNVAAKTGTAQTGKNNQFINSWVIGFFPYENPKYAFAVVTEKGPKESPAGAQYVMRQVLDWMTVYRPEYLK